MKPLILNTFDLNSGSALAAQRLNRGLQELGIASQMLVYKKYGDNPTVLDPHTRLGNAAAKVWRALDPIPLSIYQRLKRSPIAEFSISWLPDWVPQQINPLNPDLINLHWINYGYVNVETLARLHKPLVWTLHDMWAFTGGCHYSQECDRYTQTCGACPQLYSTQPHDLSHWLWQQKARAWKELNVTVVTPSSWLADCARTSSLFRNRRIEVIPNGLDTNLYSPRDRNMAREKLGLPHDKHLILFGAVNATSSRRKGFHLLAAALHQLRQARWYNQADLVIFGAAHSDHSIDLGFKTHYLGKLDTDSALALAYAAADVFVAPSIQENLPNTLVEAIACGTPCVAFNIGGIPEIIEHCQNGYLAQPYQIEDLAQGIEWVLTNPDRHRMLSHYARQKAEQKFKLEIQAKRYLDLFEDVIMQYNRHQHSKQHYIKT